MARQLVDSRLSIAIEDHWPSLCAIQTVTFSTNAANQRMPSGTVSYINNGTIIVVTGEKPNNFGSVTQTLTAVPISGSERVYRNGLRVYSLSGYTILGKVITLSVLLMIGETLSVDYYVSVQLTGNVLDSIPCRLGPLVLIRPMQSESREEGAIADYTGRHLKLSGYYPSIEIRTMVVLIDGVTYQIRGIEHDSQNFSTRLHIENVTV